MKDFIGKMTSGRAIVDKFDPHVYKDIRWDMRVEPYSTSMVDKQAHMQQWSQLVDFIRALTPPFHTLIPFLLEIQDLPGKEKIKDEITKIIDKLGAGQAGPSITPEMLADVAAKLESDGLPEEIVRKFMDAIMEALQASQGGEQAGAPAEGQPAGEGGGPTPAPPAMPVPGGMASLPPRPVEGVV